MRDVPIESFTLSEYLPGRDFACQTIWKDGAPILFKAAERLSYHGGASRASGVSSTPALARTVLEPRVIDVCRAAILTIDPHASGVFGVDLKESSNHTPCVTEINAGRFFMITPIFDLTGRHNTAGVFVQLAQGTFTGKQDEVDYESEVYLIRDLDTLPILIRGQEICKLIETHPEGDIFSYIAAAMKQAVGDSVAIEVSGDLDTHEVEAVKLWIHELARRQRTSVDGILVEKSLR